MALATAILLGFCFLVVLGAVVAAGYWFLQEPGTPESDAPSISVVLSPIHGEEEKPVVDTIRRIGEAIPLAEREKDPLRKSLSAAGYRSPSAPSIYNGLRTAGCFLLALGGLWAGWAFQGAAAYGLLGAVALGGFGFLMARRVLAAMASKRKQQLRSGLPAAMDLMVLSMEAGQSMDFAIAESGRELRRVYPVLSREFQTVGLEMLTGQTRATVLENLGDRNEEPELEKLVRLLVDADRFGTPLAPALRDHARIMRTRRRQLAQEKARKVSVKLIFPVFFLVFPSVLVITLGPAVLQLYSNLIPMMTK
jgi:tight adherence protein C